MRLLTREWGGEFEQDDRQRVWDEYRAYLATLVGMPAPLAEFSERSDRLSVHDAILQRVSIEAAIGRISITLLQGADAPYGFLTLVFEKALFTVGSPAQLERWATNRNADFLWEEISKPDAPEARAWQVGFVLSPDGEFAIACDDFSYEWIPLPDELEDLTWDQLRPKRIVFEE